MFFFLFSGKNFKCIKCNFKSCTKVGLIIHETEKHRKKKPKKYRCDECKKKCGNAFKLLNHKILAHSQKIFDKNSTRNKTLRNRTKMKYDITVENYVKNSPKKIVPKKKSDEIEILSHNVNHKCPQCDCTYKVTAGLKMHVKTALKENSVRKCSECKFISCTRKGMQFHEKVLHLKITNENKEDAPMNSTSKKSNVENSRKQNMSDFRKDLDEVGNDVTGNETIADPVSMEKVLENPDDLFHCNKCGKLNNFLFIISNIN